MKKGTALLSSMLATVLALTGCGKKEGPAAASSLGQGAGQGKVLNIYCWNEEFQTRFADFYASKNPAALQGVQVRWILTPNLDNAYQNKLDEALLAQDKAEQDDKIDIFLVEGDVALKYVNSGYALDVKKDVGLSDQDLSKQYKYTQDIMTDSNGVLRGTSWQATPAGMIYRRSIAKAVLGTDDPDLVQEAVSDWNKFNDVAQKAKEKGYFMVSGYDDTFRVFLDNMSGPWVNGNKIVIDQKIRDWVAQTKEFTEKGYNDKASMWTPEMWKGAQKDGKVFCYFGPAWFIDYSLAPQVLEDASAPAVAGNGSYGDWAFCRGPESFSWGGTWICAARGTDNIEVIRDLMYTLTCDDATMTEIAKKANDFTNNETAMTAIANSDYHNDFLGGQNHILFFLEAAKRISKENISGYDQGMVETIEKTMKDYYDGVVSEERAWNNFYTSILEMYPNLSR